MTISTDDHRMATTVLPTTGRGFLAGAIGLVLAVALVVLGGVMKSNAEFAEENVERQLSAQRIVFKPLDALTDEERRVPCLVAHAGRPLVTGKQAECYADHFIGAHLKVLAGGRTFAEMRDVQSALRARLAEAQARNDPQVADLQRQLNEANGQRQALFEGESNRGLLLTAYGFSTLGAKADQAADAAYGAAAVLAVAAALSLLRAWRPRSG